MALKRLLDVVLAMVAALMLFPLAVLIALAVRLESSGPAIFRQRRIGLHGREFTVFKFRTMSGAARDRSGTFEPGNTTRVTRVGRMLRRSKLDELPQLWNVVVGDMSLVGPRPEVPRWVEIYPQRWQVVHSVRPGLTDPASLAFIQEESL